MVRSRDGLFPDCKSAPNPSAMLALAALVIAAFAHSAASYFLSDDFVLLKHAPDYRRDAWLMFHRGGGDGFYRPIGYMGIWITEAIAGRNPIAWHAISLAIHIVNCWLFYAVASALGLSRFASIFAAALFAIHGSRPEAVVWIAGRFDLLATCFTLLALFMFMRRRDGIALAAAVLAMLSKESAFCIPLLIAIVAIGKEKSVRRALPFWAVAAIVFCYRAALLHGIGGYVTATGQNEVTTAGMRSIIETFVWRLWAVLFFPINWKIPLGLAMIASLVIYAIALLMLVRATFSRLAVILSIAILFACSAPMFHRLLIGADLEKSRYLYLPAVGFCLLIAIAADGLRGWTRWVAAGAILFFHLAAIEHNLIEWRIASDAAESACAQAAASVRSPEDQIVAIGLPRVMDGVYFFQNGFPECVSMRSGLAEDRIAIADTPPRETQGVHVFVWDSARRKILP